MELTKHQQNLFNLGKQAKETVGDMDYKTALRHLYFNDIMIDILEDLPNDTDRQFFEAGFYGFEPQWRQAYRYGEIPSCGYSTNWGTKEFEKGVSCTCLIGSKNESNESIYDTIYGVQDIKKIKIEGWYSGDVGSDGEPLLIQARKVEE